MALTSIFVERRPTGPSFTVNQSSEGFVVDASLSETYNHDAEITDNPVEQGLDVSDNINVKPLEIQMTLLVSETPIVANLASFATAAAVTIGSKVGQAFSGSIGSIAGGVAAGALAGVVGSVGGASTRVKTNYDNFRNLLDQKAVLTVQTGLEIYPRMVIKNLRVNRSPQTGKALNFTVTLRELRIVSSQLIELPEIDEQDVADRAAPSTDLGRQSQKQLNSSESSIAAQLYDSVF